MKKLYFIRHGESEGNALRIMTGRLDLPLTKNGKDQARQASKIAKNLNIDCIVSSPLCRASETAEIIAEAIGYPKDKIILSALFMERGYGDLQGEPYEKLEGIDINSVSNIETESELIARSKQASEFLKSIKANIILVCAHGTLGRTLRDQLLDRQAGIIEVAIEEEIPNAEIVRWV